MATHQRHTWVSVHTARGPLDEPCCLTLFPGQPRKGRADPRSQGCQSPRAGGGSRSALLVLTTQCSPWSRPNRTRKTDTLFL